jgi:glycosyltransferase involved in cell wall biosynthesis
MRIAIVSTPCVTVPPQSYGGTELVIATLAAQLTAQGHHVTVYATGDSRVTASKLRHCFATAAWPPHPYLELAHAQFALADIVARDDADVVHAHIPSALPFAPTLRCPLVYTVHHDRDEALLEFYRRCRASNIHIVAISRRQSELLGDLDTEVVHHGLNPTDYPLGRGGSSAVFLGRFDRVKGPHTAIDVARAAGVLIQVAGKSHGDEPFCRKELNPRLKLRGVEYVGPVAHESKVRLLGGALATLFPADWEEPFGLVPIESMLCGTPVIAFARGALPETVDDAVTGFIVRDCGEMVDRLRALHENPGMFDRGRCRAHVSKRFSASRMAADYLAVYEAAQRDSAVRAG